MKNIKYILFILVLSFFACKKEIATTTKSATADEAQLAFNGKINATVIDGNNVKWTGTNDGLIKGTGKDAVIYTPSNSFFSSGVIQTLAVGNNNTIWIGTDKGLIKYTGTNWSIYTTDNGMLPNDNVKTVIYNAGSKQVTVLLSNGQTAKIN